MTDYQRTTLERALSSDQYAEALQAEAEPYPAVQDTWPAVAERSAAEPSWNADRAHARLRLLAGLVGMVGSVMIVAILIMGEAAHG